MKEKEIKTEKVDKKKIYGRSKKMDKQIKTIDLNDEINEMFMRSGEVIKNVIKIPKKVGYYRVGRGFNIFFEKKPSGLKRFFSKVLLGWHWIDQK